MAGTVVVAVRKAVTAGLAAAFVAASEPDVLVTYGWPRGDTTREKVFTNRASAQTPPAALRSGRNFRDEAGEFEVVVLVEGVGLTSEETDTRAQVLLTVVEQYLADRKSNELAVSGLSWIRADRWDWSNRFSDQGTATEVVLTVKYAARIT